MHYGFDQEELDARDAVRDVLERYAGLAQVDAVVATQGTAFAPDLWNELIQGGWFDAFAGGISEGGKLLLAEEFGSRLPLVPWKTLLGWCASLVEDGVDAMTEIAGDVTTAWLVANPVDRTLPSMVELADLTTATTMSAELENVDLVPTGTLQIPVVDAHGRLGVAVVALDDENVEVTTVETVHLAAWRGRVRLNAAAVTVVPLEREAVQRAWLRFVLLAAAQAVGGLSAALALSIEYASTREQFGVPIGTFQAIKHKLGETSTALENARTMSYLAADSIASRAASTVDDVWIARAASALAYTRGSADAIQVHGGIGFTWEAQIHLYYRDALAITIGGLGAQDLREYVIA